MEHNLKYVLQSKCIFAPLILFKNKGLIEYSFKLKEEELCTILCNAALRLALEQYRHEYT